MTDIFHETKRERKFYEDKKQKALDLVESLIIRTKTNYGKLGSTEIFAKKNIPVSSLIDLKYLIEDI